MTEFFDMSARAVCVAALMVACAVAPTDVMAQATDEPQTSVEVPPGDSTEKKKAASVEDQLVFVLGAYHGPASREELDTIGSPELVTAWLRAFAASSDLRPSMRTRAVDALGYYDDTKTVSMLERFVHEPGSAQASARVADALRHHAIASLARARGDAALETLEPLLAADDLQVQLTTIVALGEHGDERSRSRLAQMRSRVEDRELRRVLDKYVDASDADD